MWLDLSRVFLGIQNNLKNLGNADCIVRVISSNPFGNSACDILGVKFWSRDFFWFC